MDEQPTAGINYLSLLRRIALNRWRTVLIGFLAIALPAAVWVFYFAPKMYEASATLFFAAAREGPSFLKEYMTPQENALYLAILQSRSISQAVIDSLPRESRDELLKQTLFRDYLLSIANRIRRAMGEEVSVLSPQELMVREIREARMTFKADKEGVVTITALAFNPRVATDLANTYVEVLLSQSGSYSREQARASRELLENLLTQARASQREAEEALRKFQAQGGGGVKLPDQSQFELAKLSQLEGVLADIQVSKEIAQAQLAFLRGESQKAGKPPTTPVDAATQPLRERLTQLEAKLAALSEKYTDQHPLVRTTAAEIQEAQERLRTSLQGQQTPRPAGALTLAPAERAALSKQMADLEVQVMSLQAREDGLKQRIARVKQSLSALSARELEYSGLSRTVQNQQNLLSLLSEKLTAARVNEQSQIRSIKVIDQATAPRSPSSKQWMKVLLLGLVGGLALGGGVGALREHAREVVETEEDVVRATGLPVLGSVPLVPRALTSGNGFEGPVNFLDGGGPFALPVEAFRSIRTALETQEYERPLRTLLVTSPGASEGKTTVTLNLGWAFLETGRRVVLMDADLRRPALHRALQAPNEVGLANMLQEGSESPEGYQQVKGGLELVSAGVRPADPGALVSSRHMRGVLVRARERSDLTLLDSPPILAVSDNLTLASQADGVVLVVRVGMTQRTRLVQAKSQLDRVRARIVGVVVNGLSPRQTRRYYAEYTRYVAVHTSRKKKG